MDNRRDSAGLTMVGSGSFGWVDKRRDSLGGGVASTGAEAEEDKIGLMASTRATATALNLIGSSGLAMTSTREIGLWEGEDEMGSKYALVRSSDFSTVVNEKIGCLFLPSELLLFELT
jgi:hypothetical protein